jgi:hypothetical protein
MTTTEKARAALAANPFPPSPFVEVTDDAIIIKSGFSEQLLQLLRWVPNVQWRPERRCWTVPISGAATVRAALPEILRLAEATQQPRPNRAAAPQGVDQDEQLSAPDLFRKAARLIFGGDWQRDCARALNRDEAALAGWLAGDHELEDPRALLDDMLALMRRRAVEIAAEADRLAAAIERSGP